MFNFLFMLADGAQSPANGWVLPLIMVAFIVLLLLTSIIPQKKRRKQMENMLANLKAGDEIKTIGGMVGKITAVNNETGILTINVGTEAAPTYINIDKVAIYTVAPVAVAEAQVAEEAPVNEVVNEDK